MIKIMRGIVILAGIVLLFLLMTACSGDSIFVKKNKSNQRPDDYKNIAEKEEYSYNESEDNERDYLKEKEALKDKEKNDKIGKLNSYDKEDDIYLKEDNQPGDDNYYERGYASWYGREFHGRKTASGEKYDMNKLTAAHKRLPFGTRINVKNLENGETVSVTINDRGPYEDGRILDLSYAAAKKIGIIRSGEAKVGIKVVGKGEGEIISDIESNDGIKAVSGRNDEEVNAKEDGDSSYDKNKNGFSVQAGAFYSRKNAEKFQKRLEKLVDNPIVLINDNDMYKIRIDKFASRKEAQAVKKILKNEDISSYIVENKR